MDFTDMGNVSKITILLFLLGFVDTGCVNLEKVRQEAYDEGHEVGHELGQKVGHQQGFQEGVAQGKAIKYSELVEASYNRQKEFALDDKPYVPTLSGAIIVDKIDHDRDHFGQALMDVHKEVLKGVGTSIGLHAQDQTHLITTYEKFHPQIVGEYFTQYKELCDRRELDRRPDAFITYRHHDRTAAFADVLGQQLCATLGVVLGLFEMETGTSIISGLLVGEPCRFVAGKIMKPISEQLLESGFVKDIEESKITVEKKISNIIFELATVEKHYEVSLEKERTVGVSIFSSSAIIKASYYGIVKAGYNLGNHISVGLDKSSKKIQLALDLPKIFDPIVYPRIDEIENGWWSEIDKATINEMYANAMAQVTQKAIDDNILREAESNAKHFLSLLFGHVAQIPPTPYSIEVTSGGRKVE